MTKRNESIDFLKGFAIICVLIGHISAFMISSGLFPTGGLNVIYKIMYLFHIPFFFAISGYVEKYSKNNDLKKKIKNGLISLVIPYFLFSYLMLIMNLVLHNEGFSLINFLTIIYKPISNLWFIYALFFIKIMHSILSKYINNNYILSFIWILLCISSIFIKVDNVFISVMSFGVCYYFGLLIGKKEANINNIKWFIASIATLVASALVYFFLNDLIGKCIFGVVLFALLYSICNKINISNKVVTFIGINSMIYFVIDGFTNSPVISITYNMLHIHNVILCFILCLLIKLVISTVVVFVSKKIKIVNALFYPAVILKK